MGHGIAQVFLLAGSAVRVWDPDEKALAGVPARIDEHLELIGIARPAEVQLAGSIRQAAAGADLIVEAAPENLTVKRQLVAEFDAAAPGAIVATNTSVLKISEIADGSAHPERVVGTHWWNPPYLIPVVEVVPGEHTAKETVSRVTSWLRGAGKTVVPVRRDVPGFIGNRMQFALWREAMAIVQEGISDAETVELVARNTVGLRLAAIGPLSNADFIGLDLTRAIMDYLLPSLSTEQQARASSANCVSRVNSARRADAASSRGRARHETRSRPACWRTSLNRPDGLRPDHERVPRPRADPRRAASPQRPGRVRPTLQRPPSAPESAAGTPAAPA
jgi:3-hydroxybutyryl-CoA dehydrogenase